MALTPTNPAAGSTPARTYTQRLEQALMWLEWELSCDQSGHGGVIEAVHDLVPEFNSRDLAKQGYSRQWPDHYGPDSERPENISHW